MKIPDPIPKAKGALPGNSIQNGLIDIVDDLVADQRRKRYIVAVVDVESVTHKNLVDDGGEEVDLDIPTIRVLAIEQVRNSQRETAAQLLADAREARSGRPALWGSGLLAGVDYETGERPDPSDGD